MRWVRNRSPHAIAFLLMSFALVSDSFALDWYELWQTPAQRAARMVEHGNYAELIETAPNEQWQGVGHYRQGNYAAAAEAFANSPAVDQSEPPTAEQLVARYNQANTYVQQEQYEQALALYDDVLKADPAHRDAVHNRAITEKLMALQENSSNSDSSGQDGSSDDKQQDKQKSSDQGQQEKNQQEDAKNNAKDEPSADDQNKSETDQQNSNQQSAADAEQQQNTPLDNAPTEQEMQDAADALAASAKEAETDAEAENSEDAEKSQQTETQAPLSEQEQATEQWLRRIPDDPSGLLRRKLQQSHANDYQGVKNGAQPW